MSDSDENEYLDKSKAIELLLKEAAFRPIVPFLGAGVSISAGFPAIRAIVHYLAKVEFAIEFGVFSHRYPGFTTGVDPEQLYRDHPSRFLKDFGWPELGQLDADLWAWLDMHSRDERVCKRLKTGLFSDFEKTLSRDGLHEIVQWMLHRDLEFRESAAARHLKEVWKRKAKGNRDRLFWGDWETLLDRLSEGSLDLTDELFASLEQGRSPTLAHRYLVFLQSKLGMPLVLTTNFDSLLERALQEEGINANVFSVHRDAELPEPALVRQGFGILKLHGSTYGLRVGERLKYPLEAKARRAVLQYIPKDAMLLVIGFGGNERRIMQLFHAVAKERRKQPAHAAASTPQPRILWLKTGEESPFLKQLRNESGGAVQVADITDVNMFLQQTYFQYAGGFQASSVGYPALLSRPFVARRHFQDPHNQHVHIFAAEINSEQTSWGTLAAAQFVAARRYDYNPIWIDLETHHTVTGVVADLFDQIRRFDPLAPELTLIEESGEGASTAVFKKVVDRIAEAFQRGRYIVVFDSLESFARPQMSHHGTPTYRLFNLKPKFTNPFPEKYGDLVTVFERRVTALKDFLLILLGLTGGTTVHTEFRDSYICVTIDSPFPHDSTSHPTGIFVQKALTTIKKAAKAADHVQWWTSESIPIEPYSPPTSPTQSLKNHLALEDDTLKASISRFTAIKQFKKDWYDSPSTVTQYGACMLLLSVFRRPRPIPVLTSMISRWALQPLDEKPQPESRRINSALDSALEKINEMTKRREGDILWMYREVQHAAWRRLTCNTRPANWIDTWNHAKHNSSIDRNATAAFIDGMTTIAWHLAAARVYYADVFMPTKDISAFYEYLYHRVDALRDIALMLILWRQHRKAILDRLKQKRLDLRELCDTTGVFASLGKNADAIDGKTPLDQLRKLRQHGLRTLLRALERNRDFLRAKSPPDTLLAWSQQFLDRDIEEISGAIYRLAFENGTLARLFGRDGGVGELRNFFKDLTFQEYTTKLDYLSALEWLNDEQPSTDKDEYQKRLNKQFAAGNEVPSDDADVAAWRKYVQRARCFLHLGLDEELRRDGKVYDVALPERDMADSTAQYRQVRRDALEVRTKTLLAGICLLWHGLDKDSGDRTWEIATEDESQEKEEVKDQKKEEDVEKLKEHKERREKVKNDCQEAIYAATEYERWVREISGNREEDARHRSGALVLRARAEYLQGRFRQAHQLLDVASSGLLRDRVDHLLSKAIVHLYRAELLLYSADYHFTHPGPKSPSSASKELRKVGRAENELAVAEESMREVKHQAGWRMGMHVGWAQTRLERLLFELEVLWQSRRRLDQTQYSRRTGEMERILLHGMRHLRNALDLLPYRKEQWDDVKTTLLRRSPLVDTERKVYSLWCSYFIVGGVYWTLLYQRHAKQTSDALLRTFLGTQEEYSKKQWILWCLSLRFDQFAEFNVPLSNVPERTADARRPKSLREEVIRIMHEVVRGTDSSDPLEKMWDSRRPQVTKT